MSRSFSKVVPPLGALLTGMLMAAGFPPYDRWFTQLHLGGIVSLAPWVAFAPLTIVLLLLPFTSSDSLGKRFWQGAGVGYLSGITFFVATIFWVGLVAWEGVVALPLYLGIYQALWGAFFMLVLKPFLLQERKKEKLKERKLAWPWWRGVLFCLLAAAAWSGLEWMRGVLFTGFPWNSFGVALHDHIALIQIADLTGIYGISFVGVMSGCLVGLLFVRFFLFWNRQQEGIGDRGDFARNEGTEAASADQADQGIQEIFTPKPIRSFFSWSGSDWQKEILVVVLLLLTIFLYGIKQLLAPAFPTQSLKIAAIQGNIPMADYWDDRCEEYIRHVYLSETEKILPEHPDLIIWPEQSTLRPFLQDPKTMAMIEGLLQKAKCDFLGGSLQFENNPNRDYNAAVLLTNQGAQYDYYAKTHLVPFGEYIPFRNSFPLFRWIIGNQVEEDFTPGQAPHTMKLSAQKITIGTLICFEDVFGPLVGDFVRQGAQGMIVVINDGWFGHSAASRQHEINALFRTVETKVPLLRVADTGVTVVIDRFGREVKKLQDTNGNSFLQGSLVAEWELPKTVPQTFYTQYGNLFAKICLLITLLLSTITLLRFFLKKT